MFNCVFHPRSLYLIPRASRIRQKKYTSAKGGSKLVDWSKGKWEKINTLFDKCFPKLKSFQN